jgi:hypothetical protein
MDGLVGFIVVAGALVGIGFLPFVVADWVGARFSSRRRAVEDFAKAGSVNDKAAIIRNGIVSQF